MRILAALAALALAGPALAAGPELKTDQDKTLYAMGVVASKSFSEFNLTPKELEVMQRGMTDALTGKKPAVDMAVYEPKVQELAMARMKAASEARKEKEKGVVAGYAKEKGAQTTPSGMVFIPMKEGTGASPKATDKVKVNYEGKLTSGSVFDSSYKRGQPAEFPLNQVIPCWTEGVQKLKVGGKARLVCPPDIAYGPQGRPPVIPGNATLVFEVELLEIAPPAAPAAK
jgi:FKBP-type peptidyl-prolyl cis-trans isomerase FkpA